MIIKVSVIFFVLFFAFTTYPQSARIIEKTDSLRSRVSKYEGKQKLLAYLDLIEYLVLNQPDKVLLEKENILTLAEELNDKKSLANIYLYLGDSYYNITQRQESIEYFNKALTLSQMLNDSSQIASALIQSGRQNIAVGLLVDALKNFENALAISEKSKDIQNKIMAINYLGILNYILDNIEEAEKLAFQAFEMSKKINYQEGISLASEHIAIIRIKQKRYQEALEYNSISYQITKNKDFITNIPPLFYNYAIIYNFLGEYEKAIDHLNKSIEIRKSYGDTLGLASEFMQLGRIYLAKKDNSKAIINFKKALNISKQTNDLRKLVSINRGLSTAYENFGEYYLALFYFKGFKTLSDSLYNENVKRETAKLTAKKLLEEKEKEVQYLKEINIAQSQLQKYLVIFSSIILFLFVLSILLYLKVRKSKQHLSEINQKLISMDKERNKFFSIITHDLRSPFLGISGLIELLRDEVKNLNNQSTINLVNKLDVAVQNQYKLVDNLLNWLRIQSGKMKYEPTEVSLTELMTNAINNLRYFSTQKNVRIKTEIEKEYLLNADKNMILSVFMNLISNSIKFSYPDSDVNILISQKEKDFVSIQIKDTGVGIPQEKISKFFDLDSEISTAGTENEKGTGLGLHIVKEMLDINNGKISVISNDKVGTTFEICLPLAFSQN